MPIIHRLAFLILLPLLALTAAEPLATFEENSVEVVLSVEAGAVPGKATLIGLFTPKPKKDPLHLYSIHLTGADGGVATKLVIRPGQELKVRVH